MLASLGTFFRDISEMMPSFSMAILFGSAVFYPVDQIPESIWRFLKFNPILHVVNELRSTVLWQNTIDMSALIYIAILSLSFLVCGWFIFHLTRHKVSEIV